MPDLSPDSVDSIKAVIDSFLVLDDSVFETEASRGPLHQSEPVNTAKDCEHSIDALQAIQFLVSGSLDWKVMVEERTRIESDFVRDSIRKNSSYEGNTESPAIRLRKDGSRVDAYGIELMRKLHRYQDGLEYSSSGGYRQMRHTGIPNAAKLDSRGEARSLVANKTSNVRIQSPPCNSSGPGQ